MKSIIIILTVAILAVCLLAACKNQSTGMKSKSKVKDIWLNSHRPSPKPDYHSVQFGTERSDEAWQELLIPIEGFTYSAGHFYKLRVEELEEVDGIMSYRLVKIISTQLDPLLAITDIYVLNEIPGTIDNEQLRDIRCTVEINASDLSILGNAPCNSYSGSIVELSQSTISFGPLMASKMACPNLSVEQAFFNQMAEVKGYARKGLLLHLTDVDGNSLLVLRKVD